jgi:hypothetical protein
MKLFVSLFRRADFSHGMFDFDAPIPAPGDDLEYPYGFIPFKQTGALPMSSALTGTVVRLHSSKHLWTGQEFRKTFEDGPWKWSAKQRYAGHGINVAHILGYQPMAFGLKPIKASRAAFSYKNSL